MSGKSAGARRIALRWLLGAAAFAFLTGWAHACLFARDTQPRDWYAWASALFSGDVTSVQHDGAKSLDLVAVRVAETFKGPEGAVATLQVPSRFWKSCRLERPAVGAHVLVALNPNGDTFVVPLTAAYTEQLRQDREYRK